MLFKDFCRRFHVLVEKKPPLAAIIEEGRSLVGELSSDPEWFREILERLVLDREYLDRQRISIWPNEVTLYRDPNRSFVVLAYLWEPRDTDTIHDHGSWGIIGELISPALERKFRRLDDGRGRGHAELEETSSRVIKPGDTTFVLPLNEGIHQMENLTDDMAVSINVYGKTVRKGYVQYFYPERKSVRPVFPPRTFKEILAIRTLGAVDRSWAEDILRTALRDPLPDFLRKECEDSLALLDAQAGNKGQGSEG
jgi:predicted metal-dependent enzyme (double-stranded beta helix superfamily)